MTGVHSPVSWHSRRVLVTGASGFLGSHLTEALVRRGARVTAFVRKTSDCWRLASCADRIEIVRGELAQLRHGPLAEAIGELDIVYHLAAAGTNQSDHDAAAMLNANVIGTHAVLALARERRASRVICAGTGFEYGNAVNASEDTLPRPLTAYAASKAAASLFAHAYGRREQLPIVTLRVFSVYGPSQARCFLVPHVAMCAVEDRSIVLTGDTHTRDFVFVEDAIRAFLLAGDAEGAAGEIINVSSGTQTEVRDMVAAILRVADSRSTVQWDLRPSSPRELVCSSGRRVKAGRVLQWEPRVHPEEGLRRTVEWFRLHRAEFESHYPSSTPVQAGGHRAAQG